jgi:hypothetical protein
MYDEHGHGTHVGGLLLTYGSDADLYIIKLDLKQPAEHKTTNEMRDPLLPRTIAQVSQK